MLRSVTCYASMYLVGVLLSAQGSAGWQFFGVGLLWPGAGFMVPSNAGEGAWLVGWGVLLVLFPLSILLWFATGNALAPPLVWWGAALMASGQTGAPLEPAWTGLHAVPPTLLLLMAGAWPLYQCHAARVRRRAQRHLHEATQTWPVTLADPGLHQSTPDGADLQRHRFLLDRALQALDEFQGFDWRDQYQTGAVRYQLQFMGLALAMLQSTQPAFSGYLQQAQRQLILKLADRRVWRYWASESWWGHFRHQPNPTARDNIMYTGFSALQMALTQAASGSREWSVPGSLTLQHPTQGDFPADLTALGQALDRDLQRSRYTLMACEPNWVYPLCNAMSATALLALDQQSGAARWARHAEQFRQSLLNEFMAPNGHFTPFRSTYTGWAAPVMGGALPVAMTCFFLHALWPDLAWQQWLLLRRHLLEPNQQRLRKAAFWAVDVGHYGRSRAAALAGTALAARELGDEEVAQLCLVQLDNDHPETVVGQHRHRPGMSLWGHALEMMVRSGSAGGLRRLVHQPAIMPLRPMLSEVPYHQVMVASAQHRPDGLQAELRALVAGVHRVSFSGLQPGQVSCLHAEQTHRLEADAKGCATLSLRLSEQPQIIVLKECTWPVV